MTHRGGIHERQADADGRAGALRHRVLAVTDYPDDRLPPARGPHPVVLDRPRPGAVALPLLRHRRRRLHLDHAEGGHQLCPSPSPCSHSRPRNGKRFRRRRAAIRQPLRIFAAKGPHRGEERQLYPCLASAWLTTESASGRRLTRAGTAGNGQRPSTTAGTAASESTSMPSGRTGWPTSFSSDLSAADWCSTTCAATGDVSTPTTWSRYPTRSTSGAERSRPPTEPEAPRGPIAGAAVTPCRERTSRPPSRGAVNVVPAAPMPADGHGQREQRRE